MSRSYIKITNSINSKVVGVNNGAYQVEIDEASLEKHPMYDDIERLFFSPIESINDFNKEAINLKLSGLKGNLEIGAKFTDLMSFSPYFFGCSFMVSRTFLNCIKEFKVPEESYNGLEVQIENSQSTGFILFLPLIPMQEIDFLSSTLVESFHPDDSEIPIKSFDQFMEYEGLYEFKEISLPSKYENREMLTIQACNGLFISSELAAKLMGENLTSLEIPENQTEIVFT